MKIPTLYSEQALIEQLAPMRIKIDALDVAILSLLNERAKLAIEIGKIKHQQGSPIFKPAREQQVLAQLTSSNAGPILNESIAPIWREIMSASKLLEQHQHVAFLGPIGTFSQLAMQKYFGHSAMGLACTSIDSVFQAIDQKKVHFAVVPIENSTEGTVNRTLDLLLNTPALIIGEVSIPVQHCLLHQMHNWDAIKTQVQVICGHAQALAQCHGYLQQHPIFQDCERQAVSSNAFAAEMASKDPKYVAIASEFCAKTYDLNILEQDIQDEVHNRTRFAVLGYNNTHANIEMPKTDQTSFIVAVPNEAGAILKVLQPLAQYGVSMCRLESRPAKKSFSWEYIFMIDVEGHIEQESVAQALADIQKHSEFFKFLGSYTKSD